MSNSITTSIVGMAIAEIILSERVKRDMNIHRFAAFLNVPRSSVYNLERGQAPSINHLDSILDKLGVTWSFVGQQIDDNRKRLLEQVNAEDSL